MHNFEKSTASESPSRKEEVITKYKSMFQTYLGAALSIQNASCLRKELTNPGF